MQSIICETYSARVLTGDVRESMQGELSVTVEERHSQTCTQKQEAAALASLRLANKTKCLLFSKKQFGGLARSRARGSRARGLAGSHGLMLAGSRARRPAQALTPRHPPYNTKKIHRHGLPTPFFSIIILVVCGNAPIHKYAVCVRFRARGGWFEGWFGLVWVGVVFAHVHPLI